MPGLTGATIHSRSVPDPGIPLKEALFLKEFHRLVQIFEEDFPVALAILLCARAKNSGWMQSGEDRRESFNMLDLAVRLRNSECRSQQRLRRCRSETDDQFRANCL